MSYSALKNRRSSTIDDLINKAQQMKGSFKEDKNESEYWKPTIDKSGNGFAIIRFLPEKEGEDTPWVRYWDHGFQGPTGKWYIEKSLTSIGQEDPLAQLNSRDWNSGSDAKKEEARARKRRLHYVSNIYIISDPANPDNNGTVKKFEYGRKIFEKLTGAMQPEFEDEEPINPFSFWEGADFKLKIRNVDGYRSYDKSEFASKSEFLNGDDAALEVVYNQLYSLSSVLDPKTFKSYAELKRKLSQVLEMNLDDLGSGEPDLKSEAPPQMKAEAPAKTAEAAADPAEEGDDLDDDMSYFAKLARGE